MTEPTVAIELTVEDKQQIADCEYFQHLPEALAKGVFMDEATFDDNNNLKEVMELMAKSKYVLLKNRAWASVIGSNVYTSIFDPITRHDLALNGQLGTALGCAFYTDAFMQPHLKDKSPETMGKVIFVPRDTE
jgi:hypothetical protein